MAGVGLERHVGLGPRDAGHLGDPLGHDVGELVVLPRPDHRHEIKIAGDRVDLGHALDGRKRLAELRERALFRRDEDDRGDHRSLIASKAFDVDVVESRFDVVRGLLKTYRLAAVERGLVRVEGIERRLVVVHVELLFALVDRELDAVTRGRADQ